MPMPRCATLTRLWTSLDDIARKQLSVGTVHAYAPPGVGYATLLILHFGACQRAMPTHAHEHDPLSSVRENRVVEDPAHATW
jgi:hypothetical protein